MGLWVKLDCRLQAEGVCIAFSSLSALRHVTFQPNLLLKLFFSGRLQEIAACANTPNLPPISSNPTASAGTGLGAWGPTGDNLQNATDSEILKYGFCYYRMRKHCTWEEMKELPASRSQELLHLSSWNISVTFFYTCVHSSFPCLLVHLSKNCFRLYSKGRPFYSQVRDLKRDLNTHFGNKMSHSK